MPGRNGMGPWGGGPQTGRGWGFCGGRIDRCFRQNPGRISQENELNILKEQQKEISLRIEELEKAK
jgi:hypothetical protein